MELWTTVARNLFCFENIGAIVPALSMSIEFVIFVPHFVIAFLNTSDQNLGSWGVYTGPGGPWDLFPSSGIPNGGPGNEMCPKNQKS